MIIEPFNTKGVPGTEAIVVSFDLEGFSRFFMQQDVHLYVPDYLNTIFDAIHSIFRPARPYWLPEEAKNWLGIARQPDFVKFTGDGGIYIWIASNENEPIPLSFKVSLITDLWILKNSFGIVTKKVQNLVPLAELPARIRFGVARGTVYGLKRGLTNETADYVGFCINLAVRLQNYCREIGFIASARMGIDETIAAKASWSKATATKLKGLGREIVFVDKDEFENLSDETRNDLFDYTPSH
jgi:class 3 adenylate cyclase